MRAGNWVIVNIFVTFFQGKSPGIIFCSVHHYWQPFFIPFNKLNLFKFIIYNNILLLSVQSCTLCTILGDWIPSIGKWHDVILTKFLVPILYFQQAVFPSVGLQQLPAGNLKCTGNIIRISWYLQRNLLTAKYVGQRNTEIY